MMKLIGPGKIALTLTQIRKLKRAVLSLAKKWPDASYVRHTGEDGSSCQLSRGKVHDGPRICGCIIGQALVESGLASKRKIRSMDDVPVVATIPHKFIEPSKPSAESLEIIHWMTKVQEFQDSGIRWSTSVAMADKKMSLSR